MLRTAWILMLLPVIQYGVMLGMHLSQPPAAPPSGVPAGPDLFEQLSNVYRTGTFTEIIQLNIEGLLKGRYPDLIFTGRFFRVLAMFLVGFYISRHMIYALTEENKKLLKQTMLWGAVIGIPCNIALAVMMDTGAYYNLEPLGIIQPLVYAFGVPVLCLFYVAAIALIFQQPAYKKWLLLFAPVGQMALTNYLMQSLIYVFIFMSYGLGWEASMGPARLLLIALAIYIFQMIYSRTWLNYFRFGPMEWLWRSITYLKWQPLLKK